MKETEEAVRGFLAGNEENFNRLIRIWENKVFNFALRYLNNREDAQDVTQDTFFSAYRSLHSLRNPRSFSSWLFRIALNQCRAHWRRQGPELSLEDTLANTRNEEGGEIVSLAADGNVRDELETKELIRKSMAGLSEDHRTAILLKEYVGLSLEELAQVMECPLSTAKSRLYHGLRGVQQNLRRLGVLSGIV
jgi:RNA polymerase sigma-70 factor, ECF subfamily